MERFLKLFVEALARQGRLVRIRARVGAAEISCGLALRLRIPAAHIEVENNAGSKFAVAEFKNTVTCDRRITRGKTGKHGQPVSK